MADTPNGIPVPLVCSGAATSLIDEKRAREIAGEWLDGEKNPFIPDETIQFGKAVLIYYPFWKFSREDGGEDVVVYRPACGTLLSGLQDLKREETRVVPVPKDANILPATVFSTVYLPELHGIARGEELIGIPLWMISYKVKNSIYMMVVDGESGEVYPGWHPVKEPAVWKRTAITAFIPMVLLSMTAVYISPWFFILAAGLLIFFLYRSRMFGMMKTNSAEGKNGS